MSWRRHTALALLGFGVAGPAGGWDLLPAAVLLAAFAWLPGAVALAPCIEGCKRDGVACPLAGPGGAALAVAFSLVVLVPGVLPLFLLGLELEAARFSLGASYIVLGAAGLALAAAGADGPRERTRAQWLAVASASVFLLPYVLRYAGAAVDDWWDLSFIRSYVDSARLGFAEPFLATNRVHPRFAWNSWLVLQSLVVEFSGVDAAAFQARELAAFTCVAGVCAAAGLARSLFGATAATLLAVLALPLWLHGTEAMPYFVRLHQDKFVAALVLLPTLLAAAVHYLARPGARRLVLVGVCGVALSAVHGVVTAVALIGVATCAVAASTVKARHANVTRRHAIAVAAALSPALIYPSWQVLAVRARFAGQGVALWQPDNPVVRAHLALDRLLWPEGVMMLVNPAAVFGPVALVALAGLALAVAHRHERSARILVGLALVPAVIVFVPPVAYLVGQLFVPWMLYRVTWLVPVALLIGHLCAAVADLVRHDSRRGIAAALAIALALALAVVPTARARVARDMREHPDSSPRVPRGTTLELYRALRALPVRGVVLAPPGLSNLVPALSGHAVVAFSERGTLVFSETERMAYRRMRARATFLAGDTSAAERMRIASEHAVAYAVLRKRSVTTWGARARLSRASGNGFVLERGRGWALWAADARARTAALPAQWPIVFDNDDFVVVRTAPTAVAVSALDAPSADAARPSWQSALGAEEGPLRPLSPVSERILASTAGFPGALVELEPVPLSLGTTDQLVWTAGRELWADGPSEVTIRLALSAPCRVTGVEVIPFLQTGRREVLEVQVHGRSSRAVARDGGALRLGLAPVVADAVTVKVRSMLGLPFGLADVRLLGERDACAGGWSPLPRPQLPRADDRALVGLALKWPRSADATLGWARRRSEAGALEDAAALLRAAVRADSGSSRAWVELGLAEDAVGRPHAALAAFRRAIAVDSNSAWAHGCMAWARLRAGNELLALGHATRAARRDPRYADAYTILARALEAVGLRARARDLLLRAIALDPRRGWAYLELARMMSENGRRAEAAGVLESFLDLVPDDSAARAMLAALADRAAAPVPGRARTG